MTHLEYMSGVGRSKNEPVTTVVWCDENIVPLADATPGILDATCAQCLERAAEIYEFRAGKIRERIRALAGERREQCR